MGVADRRQPIFNALLFVFDTLPAASMARLLIKYVITVRRRLVQLFNVHISGMTIRAAGTAVEGGLAMIDVSEGSVSGVRIEGFMPEDGPGTGAYASPAMIGQGQGLILANTIESVQNEIWVSDTSISGFNSAGVLVDNRVITGNGWIGNGSRMIAHLDGVSIEGSGLESSIGQNGVEVWSEGASAEIESSSISGTGLSDGSAAAIYLRGAKASETSIGGTTATANDLSGNEFGIANLAYDGSLPAASPPAEARRNYWGQLGPGASTFIATPDVTWRPASGSKPPAPTISSPDDAAPTIEWDLAPEEGSELPIGEPVDLAVLANDDFGVNHVAFEAGETELELTTVPALNDARIYGTSWTPTEEDAGESVTFTATAVDSSGQESTLSVSTTVAELPPTCETDPTMEGCEQPPTCETNPTMEGCQPPATCETNPALEGCDQPKAVLGLSKPGTLKMKRGVKRFIQVRVTNSGTAALTDAKVCATVGKGLLKPKKKVWIPAKCITVGAIAPGGVKTIKVRVKAAPSLKKKQFKVAVKVSSATSGTASGSATVKLTK